MSAARALLGAALVLGVAPAPPGSAARAAYVVYEAHRVQPGGPTVVPIVVRLPRPVAPAVYASLDLKRRPGGGYQQGSASVGQYADRELSLRWVFGVRPGSRHLLVVPRGSTFLPLTGYWTVRATTIAARTVSAAQADEDEQVVSGVDKRLFRSATAPAGPYGSLAFARVPCDAGAGRWTLGTDTEPDDDPVVCSGGSHEFRETFRGRRWLVEGPVLGDEDGPLRLLVVDYPKR